MEEADSESDDGDKGDDEGSGGKSSSGAFCHINLKKISRGQGRSATGAAAYRSGSRIEDTRNRRRCRERPRRVATEAAAYRSGEAVADDDSGGRVHDYRRKQGVKKLIIMLPGGAPWEYIDRSTLWNAQEDAEPRCNSVVAREFDMALPCDIPEDEKWAICTDMGQWLIDNYRVGVDIALHAAATGEGHDSRNDHCHVMFTSRELTAEGFGKKTRIWDDLKTGPLQVIALRQAYADFVNLRLEKYGLPYRIDPRTLEAQGIDRIPQIHVGPNGTAQKFDGNKNPASQTRTDAQGRVIEWEKIDEGKTRAEFNAEIIELNKRRAQHGPLPLHVQIKNIEQYIEILIGKVADVKAMIPASLLPLWLRAKYEQARYRLLAMAEAVFFEKAEAEARRLRREQENMGLHARMKKMREEIERLERDKERRQALQRLYTRIEMIVAARPPAPVAIERPPTRILTIEQYRVELVAKAETARAQVPPEYRPRIVVQEAQPVAQAAPEEGLSRLFGTTGPPPTGPPADNGGLAEPPEPVTLPFNVAAGIEPQPQPQPYKTKVAISFGVT